MIYNTRCPFCEQKLYPVVAESALGCKCGYKVGYLKLRLMTAHCFWFEQDGDEELTPLLQLPKHAEVSLQELDLSKGWYAALPAGFQRYSRPQAPIYGETLRVPISHYVPHPREAERRFFGQTTFSYVDLGFYGKEWDGLPLLEPTPASYSLYPLGIYDYEGIKALTEKSSWKGIERTTEPFWRNQTATVRLTGPEVEATREQQGAFAEALRHEMEAMANDTRRQLNAEMLNDPRPGLFMTDNTTWTRYNQLLEADQRYIANLQQIEAYRQRQAERRREAERENRWWDHLGGLGDLFR